MSILKATLFTGMLLGTALISVPASAVQFIAADSTPGTQACMAVVSNKPLTLRKAIQRLRVKKTVVKNKLQCNDLSMGEFVALYNFDRSAKYLNLQTTHTSIKDIAKVDTPTVIVISASK
jgi:hypothetical protein